MEKQRKWQLFLILAVIALTVYNILPTVFYYCKPLKDPVGEVQIKEIASSIEKRVNQLESESKEWLRSFCELIKVKPQSISSDPQNPQFIALNFTNSVEAARFRNLLPRAGSVIPFVPSQLNLARQEETSKEVLVQRRVPFRFDQGDQGQDLFFSTSKRDSDGNVSSAYRQLILDRATQIALALSGPAESATSLNTLNSNSHRTDILESLAAQIHTALNLFEEKGPVAKRYAAHFTQGWIPNRTEAVRSLASAFDNLRDQLKKEKNSLLESQKKLKEEGSFLSEEEQLSLRLLEKKEANLINAGKFLKKQESLFASGQDPWDASQIQSFLNSGEATSGQQVLSIGDRNPFFSELVIDWDKERIFL